MDIYIIRVNVDVLLKTFHKVPFEIERNVLAKLHIKTTMDVLKDENIWQAKKLKEVVKERYTDWNLPPFIGFFQKIDSLDDNEYVVLCNFNPTGSYIHLCQKACELSAKGESPCQAWDSLLKIEPTGRYNVHLIKYHGIKQYTGEPDRTKRVCRFCKESGENIFREESHAISAFLGNDYFFCYEECDTCNHGFVNKLEQDLDNYYIVARSLDSCKNRNGKKINYKGKGYKIDHSDTMPMITLKGEQNLDSIGQDGVELSLVNDTPVDVRNIYKCLVKYVLSSLPSEDILPFSRTILWVKGKLNPSHLPPIYRVETLPNIERPELAILIRKDKKKDVPYCVARFAFLSNYYVFAVPYCQPNDVGNSMLKDALKRYIQLSESDISHYTIEDFNSKEKYNIVTHRTLYNEDKCKNTTAIQ